MVVAGGGAVEAALSVYLENLATTLGSREQLAVVEFALALLIIPKVTSLFVSISEIWVFSLLKFVFVLPIVVSNKLEDDLCNPTGMIPTGFGCKCCKGCNRTSGEIVCLSS
jgi:hypothetical protein